MSTTVRVDGVKETLKSLRSIDPTMRKEFDKNVRQILKPLTDAIKAAISGQRFPSGTVRRWYSIFPLDGGVLQNKVQPKINAGKRNTSVFYVSGNARAWGVWEFAGNDNSLGKAFTKYGGNPARTMWPETNRNLDELVSNLNDALAEVERIINMEVA